MANSKRKCVNCKERSRVDVGIVKGVSFYCGIDCMVAYGIKGAPKVKAKKQKADYAERVKRLKTAGDYIKEAQAAVNKYIRLRDRNKPCVSCGSNPSDSNLITGSRFDAGHYRSRGSAGHLRFNLLNIHKQCVKCNRFNSGNAVDYRIELINRIGLDNVNKLESNNEHKKFAVDYLERIKKIFNKRARFYEKRNVV